MFRNPRTYVLRDLGKYHAVCPTCGANLQPEPGFYFGAAYVSWGLTVALWVSLLVVLNVLDAIGLIEYGFLTHPGTFLWTGIVLTILTFPYFFRLSRAIWAYLFVKPAGNEQEPGGASDAR